MKPETFRKLALALPEAEERAHMDHPDFRVGGKIFATLGPDETWGMVKLSVEEQEAFCESHPEAFEPVPGAWGRHGATRILLLMARQPVVRQALARAWRNTAPRRLLKKHEDI